MSRKGPNGSATCACCATVIVSVELLRERAFPLNGDGTRLIVPEPEVKAWLASKGVPVPRSGEALSLASPLVLKAYGPGIVHKSELGGVRLGVPESELDGAMADMRDHLVACGVVSPSFFVEEMAPPGVEMIVGVLGHPVFGTLVAIGVGGILTELLGDVAFGVPPLSRDDVAGMLDGLRGGALLEGARGRGCRRS